MGNDDRSQGTLGMILVGIGGVVVLIASVGFGTSTFPMSVASPLAVGAVLLILIGTISVLYVQARNFAADARI